MMIPRLTIDLPAVLDHLTIEYLDAFKWPPGRGVNDPSLLKLQHRSARSRSNSVEDSIRLVESVWIGEPAKTHVLVLSAHVEVSPYFMHYLKYNILSQKHIVKDRERHSRLMGLALDSPSIHLNGSLFSLPTSIEKDNGFLWQAPSRHAALYFGDFWKELQSFVGRSVALQVLDNYRTPSQDLDPWQDYVLQLAKLRGYFMLYPHFLPEIIKRERVVRSAQGHLQYDERSAIVAESQRLGLPSQRYPLLATSLHQLIDLSQSIEELPLLSWDGHEAWIDMLRQAGDVFRTALKHEISCERAEAVLEHQADVEDLFCGA